MLPSPLIFGFFQIAIEVKFRVEIRLRFRVHIFVILRLELKFGVVQVTLEVNIGDTCTPCGRNGN